MTINGTAIIKHIESVEPLPASWNGDFLDLSDVQKDAAIRAVVKQEPGYIMEIMPGELESEYLFNLLYSDPHLFLKEFKRIHKDYDDDVLLELLECEATIGRGQKLHALLINDDIGFAGEIADCIYLYLESVIRTAIFESYVNSDQASGF